MLARRAPCTFDAALCAAEVREKVLVQQPKGESYVLPLIVSGDDDRQLHMSVRLCICVCFVFCVLCVCVCACVCVCVSV